MNFELPDLSTVFPVLLAALPTALIVTVGAILLNYVICRALRVVAHRTSFTEQELTPVYRIIKWVIVVAALALILGAFGLNLGGVWGMLSTILAMVAIGFVAVWSVLSNTLCTIIIMIVRPFSVGDEIELAGDPVKGRVVDLNFIYTTLDAGDGSFMQVPNNLFFQKVVRRRHAMSAVTPSAHLRAKRPETPELRVEADAALGARFETPAATGSLPSRRE